MMRRLYLWFWYRRIATPNDPIYDVRYVPRWRTESGGPR